MPKYIGEHEYCAKCGTKKVPEMGGTYDPETGEQYFRMVCPIEPCGHGNHTWVDRNDVGILTKIFGHGQICSRCGKTRRIPEDYGM